MIEQARSSSCANVHTSKSKGCPQFYERMYKCEQLQYMVTCVLVLCQALQCYSEVMYQRKVICKLLVKKQTNWLQITGTLSLQINKFLYMGKPTGSLGLVRH